MNKENRPLKVNADKVINAEPLPVLSQHILKKQDIEIERLPLQTINNQGINSSNFTGAIHRNVQIRKKDQKEKVKIKLNIPLKIDTRHVTVRQNTEDLDWDYRVFKDETIKDGSVIVISDDDDDLQAESKSLPYVIDKKLIFLEETKKAVTPELKSLQHERVKNIKKSLKRPHSRELQGLSPVVRNETGDERHKRRLVFNGCLQDQLESPDFVKKSLMSCLNRDYTADLFNYLLSSEAKTAVPRISSITRACIINWLIKVNGLSGNPAIVQTACWYFDSVLAVGHVPLEKLQLTAAACFWISQKIHSHAVTARRLIKCSCEAFTTARLLAAEKAVLNKLEFPTQPILPQDYISYLSWWCDDSHSGEIEMAATFICIAGLMVDKVLCNEWPSVIGAAAIRNAVLLLRRKECFAKLQMNSVFKAALRKVSSISYICSIQRKAVRLISSPFYEYKAPLEFFGIPPYYIAQKIVSSANKLASIDTHTQNSAIN